MLLLCQYYLTLTEQQDVTSAACGVSTQFCKNGALPALCSIVQRVMTALFNKRVKKRSD